MTESLAEGVIIDTETATKNKLRLTTVIGFIFFELMTMVIKSAPTFEIEAVRLVMPGITILLAILLIIGWKYAWLVTRVYYLALTASLVHVVTVIPIPFRNLHSVYVGIVQSCLITLLTFSELHRMVSIIVYMALGLTVFYDIIQLF
jgi:hypothetical protein